MRYFEDVKERMGPVVIRSDCRPATDAEMRECEELHCRGKCPHTIVRDERGWMYDTRYCDVCGACLGFL